MPLVPERKSLSWDSVSLLLFASILLAYLPAGFSRFDWPKILIAVLAVGAAFMAGSSARLPRAVKLSLLGAVLAAVLAMALSSTPWSSFVGRWPRYEGLPVLALYAATFYAGSRLLGGTWGKQQPRARWRTFHRALAMAMIVVGALSLLEAFGIRPLGDSPAVRPGATLGNATTLGLAGAMLTALLAPVALATKDKTLAAGALGSVIAVIASGSRSAVLVLLVALTGSILLGLKQRTPRKVFPLVGGALGLLIFVGMIVPGIRERAFAGSTVSGRMLLWEQSFQLSMSRPWFGVGPGGFVDAIPGFHDLEWAQSAGTDFPPDSPHFLPLQFWLSGGVLGMLALALLGFFCFFAMRTRLKGCALPEERLALSAAVLAVCVYFLGLLANFTTPTLTPLALVLLGAVVAIPTPADSPKTVGKGSAGSTQSRSRVTTALGLTGAIAMLAFTFPATVAEWPMAQGAAAAAEGEVAEAEGHFSRARSLRPWDGDLALLAAQAFAGPAADGIPGSAERAITWAKLALEKNPASVEAGLALAVGLNSSDDPEQAKAVLDSFLEKAPFTANLHVQRGISNFGLGDGPASIADLEYAATLSPGSPLPWQILARVHERLGDIDSAVAAQQESDSRQ